MANLQTIIVPIKFTLNTTKKTKPKNDAKKFYPVYVQDMSTVYYTK